MIELETFSLGCMMLTNARSRLKPTWMDPTCDVILRCRSWGSATNCWLSGQKSLILLDDGKATWNDGGGDEARSLKASSSASIPCKD